MHLIYYFVQEKRPQSGQSQISNYNKTEQSKLCLLKNKWIKFNLSQKLFL